MFGYARLAAEEHPKQHNQQGLNQGCLEATSAVFCKMNETFSLLR